MHTPQLTLSTLYAHSTTDIINSLQEESKSEIEFYLQGETVYLSYMYVHCISDDANRLEKYQNWLIIKLESPESPK